MITVDTTQAISDLRKYLEPLTPKQAGIAVSRSINEALTTGRAAIIRQVATVYTIKPSLVRQQLGILKSTSALLTGKISGVSRRHSLSDFKNTKYDAGSNSMRSITTRSEAGKVYKKLVTRTLTGKSMRIKDKKKLTSLLIEIRKGDSKNIPSAFLMQSNGGMIWAGRGAYNSKFSFVWRNKRVSKQGSDLPANKLLTASVYAMAVNNDVQRTAEPVISSRYMQRLEHNLLKGVGFRGVYS
jgi:hypothetical protein